MNDLRGRLRSPDALLGTLVLLDSPETALTLRRAGFTWFFLDLEHSALLDIKSAQRIIEVLQPGAFTVIRLPDRSDTWIKHALDTGSDGIIVPHVATAEDARAAVASAKYPPLGTRSVGITRAHGYGASFQEYLSQAAEHIAVIAQIEDVDGAENIEEILQVDGVDAIFIGPYDLSGSLGVLGELSHPSLLSMVDKVRAACLRAGTPLGIFCPSPEAAAKEITAGTRLIAVGSDMGHLAAGAGSALATLSGGLGGDRC
jgi:2-keto-3-deoxy-L-rhamnonate aldolase RhmA